jgi:hypothetical protein
VDNRDKEAKTSAIGFAGLAARRPLLLFGLVVALLAAIVFRECLLPWRLLLTTDDNIGAMAHRARALPHAFLGWWYDASLMGFPVLLGLSWTNVLLWLLPLKIFNNWLHAIDLGVASILLGAFLRRRGLSWAACAMGALTAFWVASNLTLTYAGHIGKFAILTFAAAFLLAVDFTARTRRWEWAVLAGGALGVTFLEQADVALFFAMALVPLGLFQIFRENRANGKAAARLAAILLLVAGAMAAYPVLTGMRQFVTSVSTVSEENPKAKWEFVTQWSWPPDEMVDFVAPGYLGWRSGEPEGPYWGRMGRSEGWEVTKQGFQNFKLESQYIGFVPVALALWALCLALWKDREGRGTRVEVMAWGAVTVGALLLSFGKYFPLYRLFYLLPGVSSIRNPNKFLQVFQLGLAVLAAYGMDSAIRAAAMPADPADAKRRRVFWIAATVAAAVFLVWGLGSYSALDSLGQRFSSQGWGNLAFVMAQNVARSLVHAGVFAAVFAAFLWMVLRGGRNPGAPGWMLRAAWGLVAAVAVDAVALAGHYVKTVSEDFVKENEVVQLLKSSLSGQRAAFVSQDSFYNLWLTFLLPYHDVRTLNITQMPRMPEDYKAFLGALGPDMIRLWQLAAVEYIVGPAGIWNQIQASEDLKKMFSIAYAFNVTPIEDGAVEVVAGKKDRPGEHCVLRVEADSAWAALVRGWEVAEGAKALERLKAADFPILSRVVVGPEDAAGLPAGTKDGSGGTVALKSYRAGKVVFSVSASEPCILRIAEKYDPDWKAAVDGNPVPVFRCDYLFQGIRIGAGLQEVALTYAPSRALLWPVFGGYGACLAAGVLLVRRKTA